MSVLKRFQQRSDLFCAVLTDWLLLRYLLNEAENGNHVFEILVATFDSTYSENPRSRSSSPKRREYNLSQVRSTSGYLLTRSSRHSFYCRHSDGEVRRLRRTFPTAKTPFSLHIDSSHGRARLFHYWHVPTDRYAWSVFRSPVRCRRV